MPTFACLHTDFPPLSGVIAPEPRPISAGISYDLVAHLDNIRKNQDLFHYEPVNPNVGRRHRQKRFGNCARNPTVGATDDEALSHHTLYLSRGL
jgi:hypothetical protein